MPWYVAAPAPALGLQKPLATQIGSLPLVLFRAQNGQAFALMDRCPFSGNPLSKGHSKHGRIVCRDHGCEFDGAGLCRRQPASLEAPSPRPCVEAFRLVEHGALLWVQLGDGPDDGPEELVSGLKSPCVESFTRKGDTATWRRHVLSIWLKDGEVREVPLISLASGLPLLSLRQGSTELRVTRDGPLARIAHLSPVAKRATVAHFIPQDGEVTRIEWVDGRLGKHAWGLLRTPATGAKVLEGASEPRALEQAERWLARAQAPDPHPPAGEMAR